MIRRILAIIIATGATIFTVHWVIVKDPKWEPVISAIGSIAALIVTVYPLLKKKEKIWNSNPGIIASPSFVAGTSMNEKEENFDTKNEATEIRKKLLITENYSELKALKFYTETLIKKYPDPLLADVLTQISNAIENYDDRKHSRKYRRDFGSSTKGKRKYSADYREGGDGGPYSGENLSEYERGRPSGMVGGGGGRVGSILSLVALAGMGYGLFRIIKYFIVNW